MKHTILFSIAFLLSACAPFGNRSGSPSPTTSSTSAPNYNQAYEEYLALGAQYVQMGRYDLAEPKLKRAIEINSQNPAAWNVLAVMYEENRDIASGFQAYQKLTASHPNFQLGWVNFATFLCKFERDTERQDLYKKMRTKDRDFQALSYIAEGDCAYQRQHFDEATRAYRQALQLAPHAENALLPLADILEKQGDAQGALATVKVAHTYVGYSLPSIAIALKASRKIGDTRTEEEMTRLLRAQYSQNPEAKALLGK